MDRSTAPPPALPPRPADAPRLAWITCLTEPGLAGAVDRLRAVLADAGHVIHEIPFRDGPVTDRPVTDGPGAGRLPADAEVAVAWIDRPLAETEARALLGCGVPVVLAGPTLERADVTGVLAEAAGLVRGPSTPVHDVRVRAGRDAGPLGSALDDHAHDGSAHLGPHVHLSDRVVTVDKVAGDVEEWLVAQVGLQRHPLAVHRPGTGVTAWTFGGTPAAVTAHGHLRLLLAALRRAARRPEPAPVRVGLLGYGAIGHEHSRAVRHVPGLALAAVCDTSAERLAAAVAAAPGVRTHTDAEALVADPDVDLVIVSTPPNSHARWAGAALAEGKHVIVEKPFALRTAEADRVLALAAERGLLAAVYQNRRFDPDHLALRRAVRAGLLGEVFHLEAFVGGYGHPCNLWHSDAGVSGGAVYDWGAHVLDQVLDLIDDPVEHVTAAEQKRVWLDVTNADHSRVSLRFVGGAEAHFVYSDLAAALKPRWYVLGTRGAVVGHWRTERVIGRTDIGTLQEDVLSPTDAPPALDLHAADGSVTRLATPPPAPYAFHAELSDLLRLGLPMSVTGAQSRRVLAVMEAAARSAAGGGVPVAPR